MSEHSHGSILHDHPHGQDRHTHAGLPDPLALRVLDGYAKGCGILLKILMWIGIIAVALFIVRWALTEYYISTHCTTVLGTRVCQ